MIDDLHAIIGEVLKSRSLDGRVCFTHVYAAPPGGQSLVFECSSADVASDVQNEVKRRFGKAASLLQCVFLPNGEAELPELVIGCSSVADVRRKPDHGSELVSQIIRGEPVEPLKTSGDWYLARLEDGYIGWIRSWHLRASSRADVDRFAGEARHRVKDNVIQIYQSPDEEALPMGDAVVGTVLVSAPCARRGWQAVRLGDANEGYTRARGLERIPRRLGVSRDKLAATGMRFLGIPYLWGGTTPKGFDCSGLVQRIYKLHGVAIPRDSDLQARFGADRPGRSWDRLNTGDLLFFGRAGDRISHVGMYLSNSLFLHAYGQVKVGSLDPVHPLYEVKLAPDWQSTRDPLN